MLVATTEGAPDISFDAMSRKVQQAIPPLPRSTWPGRSGSSAGGPNGTLNSNRIPVALKPQADRPLAQEVLEGLRPRLAAFRTQGVSPEPAGIASVASSQSEFQYALLDADMNSSGGCRSWSTG
jgi:hypothetical protein